MNNFLIQINNKTKEIKNFFDINPHRHWDFLLKLFLFLILVLIVFSLYLLYQIKNEQIFQITLGVPENHTMLKEDLLKNTLDVYDQKAAKVTEIEKNFNSYNDPSL